MSATAGVASTPSPRVTFDLNSELTPLSSCSHSSGRLRAMPSAAERSFAGAGLASLRRDGRSADQFRAVSLASAVAPGAAGSACARLGSTCVLVACRLEVEDVDPLDPNEPELRCSVDWHVRA